MVKYISRQYCLAGHLPVEWHMWFPVGQNPGHRVPHLSLFTQVEESIMGKLQCQHVCGVIHQNTLPNLTGLLQGSETHHSIYFIHNNSF